MVESSLVSVIVPVYNGSKYIRQTLNSVVSQTYPNWEIIAVDDGSTDNSLDVLYNIQKDIGNKLKIFSISNGGVSNARNYGCKQASGNYFAFLDQDDLFESTKLEKQVAILDSELNVGVVYSNISIIDSSGIVKKELLLEDLQMFSGNVFDKLIYFNFVGISTVIIRREVFEKLNGFNIGYYLCEDWELLLRAAKICDFEYVYDSLLKYRDHYQSLSYKKIDLMMIEAHNIHSFWRKQGVKVYSRFPHKIAIMYLRLFYRKLRAMLHRN